MSLSFSKLKSLLHVSNDGKSSRKVFEKLEPVVGFKMQLIPGNCVAALPSSDQEGGRSSSNNVPELDVHLIGARHLPVTFGLKTVEGYMVMVKLFPGTTRYHSPIETSSWPKFNETFKFPMGSSTKSSMKRPKNTSVEQTLPQRLFKGHFVVLTVFALLELPPNMGFAHGVRQTYQSIRRKGSLLLKDFNKSSSDTTASGEQEASSGEVFKLTKSESRRNIGSVTCFLDPKIFTENPRTGIYISDELWLPIRDITVTPTNSTISQSINSSTKGQVEVILELCEPIDLPPMAPADEDTVSQISESRQHTSAGRRWSLTDVKRKIRNVTRKEKPTHGGLQFKITTSKMRCAIKVKEEFENIAGTIYLKTAVFERDILSSTWRSDPFLPSLSTRWDPADSTIRIPLNDVSDLDHISIKISVATKNKMGKKIVLGTLIMGAQADCAKLEHWESMIDSRGSPVAMWHSFE